MGKTDSRGVDKVMAVIKKYGVGFSQARDGSSEKILKIELIIAGDDVNRTERELTKFFACEPVTVSLHPAQLNMTDTEE